ncbi:hypothetical protein BDR05DRAFT_56715 [Suillus weaverae]|nr:hypothetical protein BDR05DRAFT_56715 [Suillus weaverae]
MATVILGDDKGGNGSSLSPLVVESDTAAPPSSHMQPKSNGSFQTLVAHSLPSAAISLLAHSKHLARFMLTFAIISTLRMSLTESQHDATTLTCIRPNFQELIQRLPSSSRPTPHSFLHSQQSLVTISKVLTPESISLDDIDAEFARLEDIRNAENMMDTEFPSDWESDVDGIRKEVLEGRAFDFAELISVR